MLTNIQINIFDPYFEAGLANAFPLQIPKTKPTDLIFFYVIFFFARLYLQKSKINNIFNHLRRNSKKLMQYYHCPWICYCRKCLSCMWRTGKVIVRLQFPATVSVVNKNEITQHEQRENNYKMQLSSPQQKRQSLSNISQSSQMMSFFGSIHSLRGNYADRNLLPEKVLDESASDSIVERLLLFGVEMMVFGVRQDELAEGVLIDIIVHFAPNHALEQVKSLGGPPLPNATFGKYFINDSAGLSLLLDEGQNQSDDVGDHVAILQLLGLL